MPRRAEASMFVVVCLMVLAIAATGFGQESTPALRARADAAAPGECAHLCIDAARRLIAETSQLFSSGDTEAAHKLLADAVHYADLGTRASVQTHHHLKDNEITIRHFIRRLGEAKRTLSIDDREAIDRQIAALEKMRDQLLDSMFGTPKKSLDGKQ